MWNRETVSSMGSADVRLSSGQQQRCQDDNHGLPNVQTTLGNPMKSSHFDSHNDSGFLSGTSLLSSSSVDDPSHGGSSQQGREDSNKGFHAVSDTCPDTTLSMQQDSGIDISSQTISEQLSSLDIGSTDNVRSVPARAQKEKNGGSSSQGRLRYPRSRLGLTQIHIALLNEIFQCDDDGDTQLHIAVMRGFVEVVYHITRLLPHQAFLDISNNTGRTALHLAVAGGDAQLARHLLVCGASPVTRDLKGDTALHIACRLGDLSMVRELTRPITVAEVMGAQLSYPPSHTPGLLAADLNNYDGQTCVHLAARVGHQDILQHLTWYGADVNAKDCKGGRTALHYAVECKDASLVQFLAQNCRAALSVDSYTGLTPYQLAIANDCPAIASLLVELGAQGDPLPHRFTDDDLEFDESSNREEGFHVGSDWNNVDDLRIRGVPVAMTARVPVTTHSSYDANY